MNLSVKNGLNYFVLIIILMGFIPFISGAIQCDCLRTLSNPNGECSSG